MRANTNRGYLLLSSAGDTKFIYPTPPGIRQNKRKTILMYDGLNPRFSILWHNMLILSNKHNRLGSLGYFEMHKIHQETFFEIPGRDFLGILYGEVSWTSICNIVNASIFFIEIVCIIGCAATTLKFSTIGKHINRIINAVIFEIS